MPRFSQKVVDALLDKLSTDDDFRDRFSKDPRSALREVGHETPKEKQGVSGQDPVLCCTTTKLASKEQIGATRKQLSERLMILDPFGYFEAI